PDGFNVASAHVVSPANWTAQIVEGVIRLRPATNTDSAPAPIPPGGTLSVAIATVASCLAPDSSTWPTTAGSGGELGQNDFVSSGDPTLRTKGHCSFSFSVSSPQTAGRPIYSTVRTLDADGQPTSA